MRRTPTVLIVDDEPDLLEQIMIALEAEDYEVLTANNGIEALETLAKNSVDLILADIAMPDMNGYQLYERVRENPQWIAIPFIFISARAMDSDIRYGKELGVDDYLTKPIRAGDLLAAVRGKLRRGQQLSDLLARPAPTQAAETAILAVGPLRIDADQYRVWVNQDEVKLSAKEFALLEYLATQAGRVASPQELVQVTHQLETDHIEAGALLRPLILSLRRKLGLPDGTTGSVENVRGIGYRIVISN